VGEREGEERSVPSVPVLRKHHWFWPMGLRPGRVRTPSWTFWSRPLLKKYSNSCKWQSHVPTNSEIAKESWKIGLMRMTNSTYEKSRLSTNMLTVSRKQYKKFWSHDPPAIKGWIPTCERDSWRLCRIPSIRKGPQLFW